MKLIKKLKNFKNKILENKLYLIILVVYFFIAFIVNDAFGRRNNLIEYRYNEFMQGGRSFFLIKDVEVSQKFIAAGNNLNKIGIQLLMPYISTNSNVNVRVREVSTNKEILNKDVFLGVYKDGDYMEVELEKQTDSKGKEYEIIVRGLDDDYHNSVQFPYSTDESEYLLGSYDGNEFQKNNFILKTTYDCTNVNIVEFILWIIVFIVAMFFVLYGTNSEINEKTFLKLALTLGIFFIIFTPIFHNFDEWNHYFRALMISQGDFLDEIDENKIIGGTIPDNVYKYLEVYKGDRGISLKNIFINSNAFFEKYSNTKKFIKNIYFSSTLPIGHVIPAIGILFAKILGMSIFSSIMFGRLMVYIFYCALGYLTLKNLKYYKSLFFVVITIPVAFWLAGTISLDPILNITSLLFISICLKYRFSAEEENYITNFDLLMLVISAIFIITCKYLVSIPILFMFFFIPKKKFKSLKRYIIFIITSIIIGAILVGFQLWILDKYPYVEDRNGFVNQLEQLKFIKNNLISSTRMFVNRILETGCIWIDNFSYYGLISGLASSTGFIMTMAAILEKNKNDKLKNNKIFNIISVLIFFIIFATGLLALYISFTEVGKNEIEGYQFRYLISPMILLLIPIANIFNIKNNIKEYDKKLLFVILLMNIDLILGEIERSFVMYKMY